MSDVDRILQNTPGSISQQWYEDGVAVDPGTVTVGVTRANGTVLIAALTGTSGTGTNPRVLNLTAVHTAILDTLTVTWTSSAKGTLTSTLEVVGGFLFTIADARSLAPLSNTTTYPTSRLAEMRTTVEQAIEDEYGAAMVPRYSYEDVRINGPGLRVKKAVRDVRSLAVDGTAVTDLSGIVFDDLGFIGGADLNFVPWNGGATWATATVGYEHGLTRPPARIKMDALRLLRSWIVAGPIDDRAATYSLADGGSYALRVPGVSGSIFGLPDLDAAIGASPYRVGVA